MQSARSRTTSVAAFQLAAAVDHYLASVSDLERLEPDAMAGRLEALHAAMRAVRIRCAGSCALHAACVELLIGHSDIADQLSMTRGRTGRARLHRLLAAQVRRAEDLLRVASEPLALDR
jgi:hypothetical protein